jgi:FKBP-type peptidyl-prolyl cis-trans isomerase
MCLETLKSYARRFCFLAVMISYAGVAAENPPPVDKFTTHQIVESWGWIIAQRDYLAGIDLNQTEREAFLKGFSTGIRDQPAPFDLQKIFPDVQRLEKKRSEKIIQAIIGKNEAQANLFFSGLKNDTNVIHLPEGVYYEALKSGDGTFPKPQQTVNVHYTAHLIDGTEFSQMGPIDMVLVTNRNVCRGWFETIQKMSKGGTARLFVPPPFSEDDAAGWGIQPGSTMIFEIELLDVKNTLPEDLENAQLPPAPEPPEPPPSGYGDLQIIKTWGWNVGRQLDVAKFKLAQSDLNLLAQGLATGIQERPAPDDLQTIYPEVEQFVASHREQARLEARQQRTADTEALFASLKQNTNVVELPDGLRYEILKPGSGPFPKTGQTVLVNYTGRLINGQVFDKTMNEPLHVLVGTVIHGWDEGIQKINKGGKIRLYIPSSLGYEEEAVSGIPAGSTLIFEIELVDIQETPSDSDTPVPGKK